MQNIKTIWAATHSALCARKWSEARPLLEQLSRSTYVVDTLSANYGAPSFIQDRIDAVNARVDRNLDSI